MLTPKQKRFVHAYAKTFNATDAAIAAGYCPGNPTRERCAQAAWRTMKNVEVRAAIEGLKARATVDDTLSASRVLEELRRLALVDLRSLYRDDGTLKDITEWSVEQGSAVQEIHLAVGAGGTKLVKIRLWDKTKSLEMLAKHFKLTAEHTEISGGITISWLPSEPAPVVEGTVVTPPALPAAPSPGPVE